jgi:hypothetical protein
VGGRRKIATAYLIADILREIIEQVLTLLNFLVVDPGNDRPHQWDRTDPGWTWGDRFMNAGGQRAMMIIYMCAHPCRKAFIPL